MQEARGREGGREVKDAGMWRMEGSEEEEGRGFGLQ